MKLSAAFVLSLLLAPQVCSAEITPITDCDVKAGYTWLPRIDGAEGIDANKMDGSAALAACQSALGEYPDEKFFHFLMARSITKLDTKDPRAIEELELAKESNSAFYYQRLGLYHEKGYAGLAPNDATALSEYIKGCELETNGRVAACESAGDVASRIAASPEEHAKARTYADKGCTNGSAKACRLMGVYFSDNRDPALAPDYSKAEVYFDIACKGGNIDACGGYGWLFSAEVSTLSKDFAKALEFFSKACDGGATRWCVDAGNLFKEGKLTKGEWSTDYEAAEAWFRKGCEADDQRACYQMAMLQLDRIDDRPIDADGGAGDDPAKVEARNRLEDSFTSIYQEFIQKACAKDFDRACASLGRDLIYGENGFDVDGARAISLLGSACETGRASACKEASWALREGRAGLKVDPTQADEFFAKAVSIHDGYCKSGNAWDCAEVQILHIDLNPKKGDLGLTDEQLKTMELGCRDNHWEACNRFSLGLSGRADLAGTAKVVDFYDTSLELMRLVCNERGSFYCTNLARDLIDPPTELPPERMQAQYDEAYSYLDAACSEGDTDACEARDREFEKQ